MQALTQLDPRTAVILCAAICAVMALVLALLRRDYPSSIRGMGLWSAALGLSALAIVLGLLHSVVPLWASVTGARMLLSIGALIAYGGTAQFFGEPIHWRRWLFAIGVATVLHGGMTLTWPSYVGRVLVSVAISMAVTASFLALVVRQRPWTLPRLLLSGVLITLLVAMALRLLSAVAGQGGTDLFAPTPENLMVFLTYAICLALFGVAVMLLASERLHDDLRYMATHDPLTNALTRRHMEVQATRELERARRHQRPLAVLAMDLDHFKSINDRYGHAAGDDALTMFVQRIGAVLRSGDLLARYGGEEFIALLPETTREQAQNVAMRILEECRTPGQAPSCTVSIGLACLQDSSESIAHLFRRADTALYRAKDEGRDRYVIG